MDSVKLKLYDDSIRPISIVDNTGLTQDGPLSMSKDKLHYPNGSGTPDDTEILNQLLLNDLTYPITTTDTLKAYRLELGSEGGNAYKEGHLQCDDIYTQGAIYFDYSDSSNASAIQSIENDGFRFIAVASETGTVNRTIDIWTLTSGTATDGFGGMIRFTNESDGGLFNYAGEFQCISTDVTQAESDGQFKWRLEVDDTMTDCMTLDNTGNLTLVGDLAVNGDTITCDGTLKLDPTSALDLDAGNGKIGLKNAGTEYSVAGCGYAGTILGYRMIGESASHSSYTCTTSFAVPDSDMNVKFVAPPSGVVEIEVQFWRNSSGSNKILYVGLSDNATYNSIGGTYEQQNSWMDETDDVLMTHKWVVTGLTPGTAYQYWLGVKTSSTTLYINWGGSGTGRFCDFIMKATALPYPTADYAEYD